MGDPCKQEGNIGSLTATVDGIKQTLDRFVVVLEKIAAQGEKLAHVEHGQGILFERMRQVEIKAASERTKMAGMVALISVLLTGITTWLIKRIGGI